MNIQWIVNRAQAIIADAKDDSEPTTPENPDVPGAGGDLSEIKAKWAAYKDALAGVEPSFADLDALLA